MTALDTLGALRIEDGRRWIDAAYLFQLEDAKAILQGDRPYNFLTRPRGASKTSDLAAVAVALLLDVDAPERMYWLAADRDQGQLCIDAINGFAVRTPALHSALTLTTNAVEAHATGARLDVLPADAASSWGLRPFALFADEFAQWNDAPGPRALWESVSSAVAKRSDARLVVSTTAGDPAHFSRKILDHALTAPLWRVNEVPGPSPWMDPDRLAEQKSRLLPSTFARLFLNQWAAGDDRLTTPEQLRSCVVLEGEQEYDPEHVYVITLDLGLKRDRTVAAIAHQDDRRIVLDRMGTWKGTRAAPVQLDEVEAWVAEASRSYGGARVVGDPWQAVGLMQRLREQGLTVDEFPFTATSVGRLAASLFNVIRDRALALPPDEELLDELAHVRLRETSPGSYRMDHDSGRHDDRAIALALAVTTLQTTPSGTTFAPGFAERLVEQGRREAFGVEGRGTERLMADWVSRHGMTEQALGIGAPRESIDGLAGEQRESAGGRLPMEKW
jgi:phage terminase large subunit-like protein